MEDKAQIQRTNLAVISLGSNINKEENLPKAVAQLAQKCTLVSASSVYETIPVGGEDQALYWNAAVLVMTELSPAQLKSQVLEEIEEDMERIRLPDKNAPRTIDLDLTLFNQETIRFQGDRSLPDPDLLKFLHVILPVAELLPQETHPETGETYAQIAERLAAKFREQRQPQPKIVENVDLWETISYEKTDKSRSS